MSNQPNSTTPSASKNTVLKFVNKKQVPVPEELYPLIGWVTVPVILTPEKFDEFWTQVKLSEDAEDDKHAVLSTYASRLCLVINSELFVDGIEEQCKLEQDPMQLMDQAIAPFVVAATQHCINRASRLPLLPKLLKNATTQ